MRFGTCVDIRSLEDLEARFSFLQKNGFDCCQLSGGKGSAF